MINKQFKSLTRGEMGALNAKFRRLNYELNLLGHSFLSGKLIMRGTVYEMKRKCGGKNCVCVTQGKLHASVVISWSEDGKTKLKTLPKADIAAFRELTQRYRDFRKLRQRAEELFGSLTDVIDQIEAKRSKQP